MFDTLCGTPLTMAPEIINRQKYTKKCDTWSFGVISYYLLYSDYPFYAENVEELKKVIAAHKTPRFP